MYKSKQNGQKNYRICVEVITDLIFFQKKLWSFVVKKFEIFKIRIFGKDKSLIYNPTQKLF